MQYQGVTHTWTEGGSYRVRDNGDHVHVVSDAGEQDVPKECCNPDLFKGVFDLTI